MIKTLGELYNYTNDILLQGVLDSIDDVIDYFEEAQQRIATKDKLEALQSYILSTNTITVPDNYMNLKKMKISGCTNVADGEIYAEEMWQKTVELPANINNGTLKFYYFKNPTPLDSDDLDQVPDIDYRYLNSMAQYAAKMYYMVDDDPDMKRAFTENFFEGLSYFNSLNGIEQPFKIRNVW